MIVFFSLNWNLEFDQQIIARLHRQGQTRPVRVVRILSAGTIDERVLRVLGAKGAVQRDLLKALRHTKG
jgi:SNF2 family DNA or RNA helicase